MPFQDGLGERRQTQDPSGAEVDLLRLRQSLSTVPSFEFALRERASRLGTFRHPSFARVRSIERSTGADAALTITSEHTSGTRLAEILQQAETRHLPIDLGVALNLLRQLVSAVAVLHETARDTAHGAIAPERLVVMPTGRLVVTEYVLGSALEQLLFSRDRYWTELRIALPRSAGLARFDHSADVTQLGVVALALVLGRRLKDDEGPAKLADLVASASAVSADGSMTLLPAPLRQWIDRTLHLDPRGAFPSAVEARFAFDQVINQCDCDTSAAPLEALLFRLRGDEPSASASAVTPVPASVEPVARLAQTDAPFKPVVEPAAASRPAPVEVAVARQQELPRESAPRPSLERERTTDESLLEAVFDTSVGKPKQKSRMPMMAAAVVALAVVGGGATFASLGLSAEKTVPVATGSLTIATDPPGAQATLDGTTLGVTPMTVPLAAGSHVLIVRGEYGERTVPVTIAAGAQMSQYLDLPKAPAVVEVIPPPAPIPTPVAAPPPDAPLAGWITVASRFDVQLFEGGKLLGTSASDRIMVAAGRHELELTNEELGFHATRSVNVPAGKVAPVAVEAPKSTLALNAVPWAEVLIDGEKAGDTPIGNVSLPIGAHDVVFRHPELGEQRFRVSLTLKAPSRLVADMRKK